MEINTRNILTFIITMILVIKSFEMLLSNFDYLENFTSVPQKKQDSAEIFFPDYEKLLSMIVKKNTDNKFTIISKDPLIFTIDKFLTKKESDHLLSIHNQNKNKSKIYKNNEESINVRIEHNKDATTLDISNRISNLLDIPLKNAQPIQVKQSNIHTPTDPPKYDSYTPDEMEYFNQKTFTIIGSLTNYEEGDIYFEKLDKKIKVNKGSIIVFSNCRNSSKIRHDSSIYLELPPKIGSKVIFKYFFHESEYDHRIEYERRKIALETEKITKEIDRRRDFWVEKAKKETDRIMFESQQKFDDIMKEAFYIRDYYNLDDTEAHQQLIKELDQIDDQFSKNIIEKFSR